MLLEELRDFFITSNVLNLSLGFTLGRTFADVINAVVSNLVMPFITSGSKLNWTVMTATVFGTKIAYGEILNALVTFIVTLTTMYFIFIKPYDFWFKKRSETIDKSKNKINNDVVEIKETLLSIKKEMEPKKPQDENNQNYL